MTIPSVPIWLALALSSIAFVSAPTPPCHALTLVRDRQPASVIVLPAEPKEGRYGIFREKDP